MLRVNYLLEDTALFGGVKIALHQAELLHRAGHRVAVVSRGKKPEWFPMEATFLQVESLVGDQVPEADLHVATFWTTIAAAVAQPSGQAVQYCQGFEASYTHNQDEHPRILDAYATPIPGMALAPHLACILGERFGRPARVVPPALEPHWRPRRRLGLHRVPRVLVAHPFENDWKGVATALETVRILRAGGRALRLIRLSQWPLGAAERQLLEPDEYHHHLRPPEVARLMAGCDLLLAPSWEQEGFGLPVLEAMACGLPVVASAIPAFRWFAAEAAALVPPRDPEALAATAEAVIATPGRWRQMRRAGLVAARAFSEQAALAAAEEALRWVADGRWRSEP